MIGSEDATALINELKLLLDETKTMSDDEVREQIVSIAGDMGYTLTDDEVTQILELVRKLEKLDVSQLQDTIKNALNAAGTVNKVSESISTFGQKVQAFFAKVGRFFSNLFGGSKTE